MSHTEAGAPGSANHAIILKLSCPDGVGLLAKLTGFAAAEGMNLLEVHQFTDSLSGWFFARLAIDPGTVREDLAVIQEKFAAVARSMGAEWSIHDEAQRKRMAIFVSTVDHCLVDLLHRWRGEELPIEIPLVISNHEILRPLVEREGVPFHHIPVSTENKEAAFREMARLCRDQSIDVIVLARYMQIVPDWFCEEFAVRLINIHHSFLPAFVGANPYRRAYERGVKLIGATCHYATPDLDEGPIIDQEVVRVEHFHLPGDLLRLGRDCERLALARGVRYHVHDRVLIHGRKSIVFRD